MRFQNSYYYPWFATKICLLSIIFLLYCNHAKSATWARVISEKARVFSDLEMTSTIGHIGRGKKIRVGEVPKNRGRLLPVVISGRVAYIQVKDLQVSGALDKAQSVVQRVSQKMKFKASSQRVGFAFGMNYSILGQNDFEQTLGNNLLFSGAGVRGHYQSLENNKGYKLGIDFMSASNKKSSEVTFLSFYFGNKFYEILGSEMTLEFFLGPVLMPYVEYQEGVDFQITGEGLGVELSTELRVPIRKAFHFHLEANVGITRFFNMKLPVNGLYPEHFSPYLFGGKLMAVLAYEY